MDVSVIVPTWNEETWLPRLLNNLHQLQGIKEIIVVDFNSSDSSVKIAHDHGCKVYFDGSFPGKSRNIGASRAECEILLFLDADVLISQDVIDKIRELFLSIENVVAVHFHLSPLSENRFILFCFAIMNSYFRFLSRVGLAQGIGSCIAVDKCAFELVGGFDENVLVAEDLELFRRLNHVGIVRYVANQKVYVSARRFEKENSLLFAIKSSIWAFFRVIGLKISLFPYNWGTYRASIIDKENNLVLKLPKKYGRRHSMKEFDLEPIKDEITFFTEKTFQFSFIYVGALFATIAGTNFDFVQAVAKQLNSTPAAITGLAIVVLNLIYLIVACSNGFAVLKRGYFIILNHNNSKPNEVLVEWERFVRKENAGFGDIGWNVDNYYVVAIYVVAFSTSVLFTLYGLIYTDGFLWFLFIVATIAHLVPTWSLIQLARLNKACRKSLFIFESEND
jgi:glycosyltransferase involved in cell wall biosynthesis